MAKRKIEENVYEDSNSTVSGKNRGGIIAFVICVLIALAIWTYAKNVELKNESLSEGDGPTTEVTLKSAGE